MGKHLYNTILMCIKVCIYAILLCANLNETKKRNKKSDRFQSSTDTHIKLNPMVFLSLGRIVIIINMHVSVVVCKTYFYCFFIIKIMKFLYGWIEKE